MGRKRKTDADLPPRVYRKHGAYYFVHPGARWERLSADKQEAERKAAVYNDPNGLFGTMVHWLDQFLLHCEQRQAAKTLAARTVEDYRNAILPSTETRARGALRVFFCPPITPMDVTPAMVQNFLATNAELGRPVPANRERACLSACFSWLLRTGKVPGLKVNPCLRLSGIKRNKETRRDRYVTHDEYRDVYAMASEPERLMMELTYRTLQRPESDIISWTSANLASENGRRVIVHQQNKTATKLRIALPAELSDMVDKSLGIGAVVKLRQPLVRRRDGGLYTYSGLSSMLRRTIAAANERRKARSLPLIAPFGFRDLKGKGATDMWRAGVPLEQIQLLCGHNTKTTTEIYVKQRWIETAEPNMVSVG